MEREKRRTVNRRISTSYFLPSTLLQLLLAWWGFVPGLRAGSEILIAVPDVGVRSWTRQTNHHPVVQHLPETGWLFRRLGGSARGVRGKRAGSWRRGGTTGIQR